MGDFIDRTDRDRALFEKTVRDQLLDLVIHGHPQHMTDAIVRALESQVALEEFTNHHSPDLQREQVAQYASEHREFLKLQVDNAIRSLIGSVLSKEG